MTGNEVVALVFIAILVLFAHYVTKASRAEESADRDFRARHENLSTLDHYSDATERQRARNAADRHVVRKSRLAR